MSAVEYVVLQIGYYKLDKMFLLKPRKTNYHTVV